MYNKTSYTDNGTRIIRVVCAIIFCLFSFVYLYFYKSDMMAIAQHVLSNGMTKYDALIGALLITLILQLLQSATYLLARLREKYHALTYYPSLLCLTFITDASINDFDVVWPSSWLYLLPVLLVLWGGLVLLFKQLEQLGAAQYAYHSSFSVLWHNMLILFLSFLFVGLLSNGNDVMHYRARAEMALVHNDIEKSLYVGSKSLKSDAVLTMNRAYALARSGELGERLFTYPLKGQGSDMLPMDSLSSSRFIVYPIDSLHVMLGARPAKRMSAYHCIRALHHHNYASQAAHDYWLCMLLMDCNLSEFANKLPVFYSINDSLPRHYAEALAVYSSQINDTTILSGIKDREDENLYQHYYNAHKGK